jgi:hypothetical protein
MKQTPFSG